MLSRPLCEALLTLGGSRRSASSAAREHLAAAAAAVCGRTAQRRARVAPTAAAAPSGAPAGAPRPASPLHAFLRGQHAQLWQRLATSAVRGLSRAGDAARAQRSRVGFALAAGGGAFSLDGLRQQLGVPRVTPEVCAATCDELLASVVRTPFTSYHAAGLYTVELAAPFPGAPVLVLTHGYGSGSGLWLFNVDDLATRYKVYLVDWLGCGASERPRWTATTVADGEAFFVDSLDAWTRAVGLRPSAGAVAAPPARGPSLGPPAAPGPFTLAGHSLGGYLVAAYALRHPDALAHLVLVSPAGIPTSPADASQRLGQSSWGMALLRSAWEAGVTPQLLVRSLGPIGERLGSRVIAARFRTMLAARGLTNVDGSVFVRYLYLITAASGSGEYGLRVLLSFGAHAREPMGPRLVRAAAAVASDGGGGGALSPLGGKPASPLATPANPAMPPVTFMYGASHDWMPSGAGDAVATRLRALGVDAQCLLTPGGGHHLYAENPPAFAAQLLGRLASAQAARAALYPAAATARGGSGAQFPRPRV